MPLSDSEARENLARLDGWQISERDGRPLITKTFKFDGFMPGVDLVNRIAPLAEAANHHPDLHLTYGSLTVELTTHSAGGLTRKDFTLAASIDQAESPIS